MRRRPEIPDPTWECLSPLEKLAAPKDGEADPMSSLHAADVAFTRKAVATARPGARPAASSAPLEFVSSGAPQPAQRTSRTADLLNPLYCTACNKVFAKETVFHAHKAGKKHIAALKAMGLFEEAEAERAKASTAAAASKRGPSDEAAHDAQPAAKRAAHAANEAGPRAGDAAAGGEMPPPPWEAEHEWWKGTVHAKPKADARQEGGPPAAPESSGEWLCVSQRCTGMRNARNAPSCKACGALRRLGTHSVRNDQRDSVNEYTRRT